MRSASACVKPSASPLSTALAIAASSDAEGVSFLVGDRVLGLAQNADDHDEVSSCSVGSAAPSSAGGGYAPVPTSALSAASSASTVEVVDAWFNWA